MTGVKASYYALLPLGQDRFYALARYISKPGGQALDLQVRLFGDGGNGEISFSRKEGKVDSFHFASQAPDVGITMKKLDGLQDT